MKYFQEYFPLRSLRVSGPVWPDSQSKSSSVNHLDDQAIDL